MKKCQLPCCMVFYQRLPSTSSFNQDMYTPAVQQGLAQILSVLSQRFIGFTIPVSLTFYAINIPLMIVAWYQIGHKFTIFTFITVSMSSLFIQFVPVITLTNDPIMNAYLVGLSWEQGLVLLFGIISPVGEPILSV